MKNIIIGMACTLVIGIFIATWYFENSPMETKLGQDKRNENQNTQLSEPSPPTTLQPIYEDESIGYSLQNDQLQITYNKGKDWTTVPVEKGKLFAGEYNGNEEELIDKSYILSENRAAFLHSDGGSMKLIYTLDQGKTWENTVVNDQYPSIRFRKVEFLNESFGYVIISGDRTMSSEWTTVYLTNDGGKQWKETNHSDVTRLIYNGGFVDENTGFLSFGILNPVEPDLYLTQDGGNSWSKATIMIPEQYHEIFVMAEAPFQEEDHLAVYINQGPNGDYEGGKVKGKFVSNDNGETWEFLMEVSPNETDK
ncbi:oxidoreductase [Neobacillus niacini]|uniref:WD40/YVTN/BNR-like repeat-containing protein n=1 Tax=Neobacillus niacini TaxID=86668 RepID=UPI002FFF2769